MRTAALIALVAWGIACNKSTPATPDPTTATTPAVSSSAATSPSTTPVMWLVAADPTVGAKQPGAVKIGCDDWLVPTPVQLHAEDAKGRLIETMVALLAALKSSLSVATVEAQPDGSFVLDLKGSLRFGGLCDPPRLIQPVERTAAQFGRVTIRVDGKTKTWRCANDESGKCE